MVYRCEPGLALLLGPLPHIRCDVMRLFLWLFVINLGVAFGAGLYEARIVFPRWLAMSDSGRRWNADAVRQDDTGRRFWAFVTTIPLTLLTIVNALGAWNATGDLRKWWLAAAGFAVADRLVTFGYFIPTMIALMRAPDDEDSIRRAGRWERLNYLRHALGLAAWLAALQTFALVHAGDPAAAGR
jgi:hypothetical protein